MAERVAESPMSGIGQVADATRRAPEVAEAAIAEVRSMHDEVKSKVAELSAHADASTMHAVEVLSEHIQKMAVDTEVKMSCNVGTVVQQLEQEVATAATSTAVMAEIMMRTIVEGMRRDVQVQIEQNRTDTLHRSEEVQHKVD